MNPSATCDLCGRTGLSHHIAKHRANCPGITRGHMLALLKSRQYANVGDFGKCWPPTHIAGDKPRGKIQGKRAHVAVFERWYGPVSSGHVVCHDCDIPGGTNPYHMFEGTQADNLTDMRRKGRGSNPPVGVVGRKWKKHRQRRHIIDHA